jgi:hypothetical protein
MPQRQPAIERQPLHLVEHRAVRRVMVGAIGPPRHDHPDRRLLAQHGAHLHRRGMGAQHPPPLGRTGARLMKRGHIERIHVLARRMMGWNIQRAEIAPIILDIRPLGDRESHGAEDRRHFLHGPADRMDQPQRRHRGRQADIHPLAGQPCFHRRRLDRRAPRFDRCRQRVLQPVQRRPALPPLLRRGASQLLQQPGQLAALAQHADADRVPRAQIGGGGQRRIGFGLKLGNLVGHHVLLTKKGCPCGQPFADRASALRPMRDQTARAACTFLTISPKLAGSS